MTAKVNVRFVDNDYTFGICLYNIFYVVYRLQHTCRRIGIGENDATILDQIIFLTNMKVFIQRNLLVRNSVQVRPHIIERICDIRKQNWLFCIVEEGHKCHSKHIIRAYADKNLTFSYAIEFCQTFGQLCCIRIRIQAKILICHSVHQFFHPGSRGIRILVGIQLDHVLILWLLAGHIRHHLTNIFFPFHHCILLVHFSIPSTGNVSWYLTSRMLSVS